MSLTSLDHSPDVLKKYRPVEAVLRRRRAARADSTRRRRAGLAARKAADLRRREYGAMDLIDLDACPPALQEAIESEGKTI